MNTANVKSYCYYMFAAQSSCMHLLGSICAVFITSDDALILGEAAIFKK